MLKYIYSIVLGCSFFCLAIEEYRIAPDDVLEIFVWQNENLSRTLPVRPDGRLSLPLIGDIEAAGLTTSELSVLIREKLVTYIKEPEVSVMVIEFNADKVSLIGQVRNPGLYSISGKTLLMEVISRAGGFTPEADMRKIKIIRNGGKKDFEVNFKNNIKEVIIENGDVIIVSKSLLAKMQDIGNVLINPILYGIIQVIIIKIYS